MPDGVTIKMVGLGGIAVSDRRLRKLRPEIVEELAESILQQGLLQPIRLRPRSRGGSGYILIAGRHRFEAVRSLHKRKLGPDSIRSEIVDDTNADAALLAEIDENLVRAELSPAERAMHTDARKTLYEKLHPETKHGATGRGRKKSSQNENSNFVKDTAKKTSKGRSTVAREAKRGKDGKNWLEDVAGTSLDKGDEIDALIELSNEDRNALIKLAKTGEKVSAKGELKKSKRADKEESLAAVTKAASESLGTKVYNVIYADPPWRFEPYSRETGMDRAADNHYPTMDLNSIKTIPIPAAKDAVLFLWATVPMLPEALAVMQAWGFTYVSNYVWIKERIGTGYWGRNKHEILLIGTQGNIPAPAPGTQPLSAMIAPNDRHSAKPPEFRTIIEKMFPNVPRLEMFARDQIDGWDTFGNEVKEAAE